MTKLSTEQLEERISYMKSRRIVLQGRIDECDCELNALEIDMEDHEALLATARAYPAVMVFG